MSSPLAHAAVACALGQGAPEPLRRRRAFWGAAVLCAILPDADHAFRWRGPSFEAWARFGKGSIPLLYHRGLMHSLPFALVAGVAAAACFRPDWKQEGWKLALFFFAVTASHGLLDGFTRGDLGVAYFAPFSRTRWLFPWRPLPLVAAPRDYVTLQGLKVLGREALWVGLPSLAAGALLRRRPR